MSDTHPLPPGIPNDPPFRSTPPPPPVYTTPPPNREPRKNPFWWLPWLLVAGLGGTVIYLLQNKGKQEDQITVLQNENVKADSSYDAVSIEYQAALARLDDLVTRNETMAREIEDRSGEVARLKGEIDRILKKDQRSAADNARAQQLIRQLNEKTRGYERRIAELEAENATLNTRNVTIARERDSTLTENVGLQQKVKLGAVLHASNIRMIPIDLRRGGSRERETTNARKVDLLRILFDIDENRIADSGPKDVYVKITNPDGNLITNAAIGSGVTTGADGTPIEYTLQKQVMLTQNERARDVNIDWNLSEDYQRGTYRIQIFNEGYSIGSGSVTLK